MNDEHSRFQIGSDTGLSETGRCTRLTVLRQKQDRIEYKASPLRERYARHRDPSRQGRVMQLDKKKGSCRTRLRPKKTGVITHDWKKHNYTWEGKTMTTSSVRWYFQPAILTKRVLARIAHIEEVVLIPDVQNEPVSADERNGCMRSPLTYAPRISRSSTPQLAAGFPPQI